MCSLAKYPYSPHERSLEIPGEGSQESKLFIGKYEALWPHRWCAYLGIKQFWFEFWPGTLCCVHGKDTLLPQGLSPPLSS